MLIGFIGLGKLGMPCAEAVADKGYHVHGYDIIPKQSTKIDIKDSIQEVVEQSDIILVATPTPHEEGYDGQAPTSHLPPKDFNYDSVKEVLTECNKYIRQEQVLALISTVLPGTIRRELAPLITNTKLIYNPYLIAMGSVGWDMLNPEMIIVGTMKGVQATATRAQNLLNFYTMICDNKPRVEFGTWEEAEAIKIFYNTFISAKVSLVNMIQDVAVKIGNMNVDVVTKALAKSTQRIISAKYMKAGMGDGGPCHPRDNIALRYLANKLDLHYDLFSAIMKSRETQAKNMAKEILKYGKNVFFTSNTYKPNTTITDGSYSLLVQHYIKELGGTITDVINMCETNNVIVRVHEQDNITNNDSVTIFDPWRSYPKAKNVVYYGDTKNV
jgi:UDPglucose 6-dehydrogenase